MMARASIFLLMVLTLTCVACSPTEQRKAEGDMDDARRKVQPALHEAAKVAKKDAKQAAAAVKREVKDLKRKADESH